MTTAQVIVPGTAGASAQVQAVAAEQHAANLANAVTGIYGLSGSGKSSLADTAAEYCADVFDKITLTYAADLGGFGSKRLAQIRAGIQIVYDPRNRRDPFETMELISLGAFPAYLLPGGPATASERERGYAPPDAELILPHRKRWQYVCPNDGTRVGQFYSPQAIVAAGQLACPTCGYACGPGDPKVRLEMVTVRSAGFARVGHRIYDSMTALNEWGLSDLQRLSASGLLPAAGQGSLLGAADALVSGQFKFGSSSQGQYGFMQTRSYNWIANIRAIPDQVVPATMTFLVEQSKGDDDSGGTPVMGPKIAGNARTSTVPGWLGNCLYAERDTEKRVHRLWLTTHTDPLDPRRVPYLAKHRGTPLNMPDYLEDEPGKPWERMSLGNLYRMLDAQVLAEQARMADKYKDFTPAATGAEEVVTGAAAQAVGVPAGSTAPTQTAGVIPTVQPVASSVPARRARSLPGAAAPVAAPPVAVAAPAAAPVAAQPTLPVAPIAGPAAPLAVPSPQVNTPTAAAPSAASTPSAPQQGTVGPAAAVTPPAPPAAPAAATTAGPVRAARPTRTPRPPV